MPVPDFEAYKVAVQEQSSSTKFNNFVQAVEDEFGAIDNDNVASGANIAVAKLAAGADGQVLKSQGGVASWQNEASASVPSGVVAPYAGATPPAGWLLCDGSAVSRTTYAGLFAAISTTYGAGDGSTTFNLPDLRGRVAVGKGTHTSVDALGDSDGVSVANRRPQHRHTPHSHSEGVATLGAHSSGGGGGGDAYVPGSGTTGSADGGSGNANDSLDAPAYLVLNYIIKT